MLHVKKEGSLHTIRELEVVTLLTLNNNKEGQVVNVIKYERN